MKNVNSLFHSRLTLMYTFRWRTLWCYKVEPFNDSIIKFSLIIVLLLFFIAHVVLNYISTLAVLNLCLF